MTSYSPGTLSSVQAQVVLSLSTGASISAAAESAGASRTTIYTWLSQPHFAQAVEMAKAEYTIALRDELHDAARKALRTLTTIMDKPDAPDSVRLKAALAILTRPQSIEQSWTLPQPVHHGAVRQAEAKLAAAAETDLNTSEHFSPVSEPELEDDLDIDDTELDEDLVNAEIDELLNEYIQAKQNSKPQPEVDLEIDALLNKSEQEKQNSKPQPVHVEKIGRNEVCPCGSGIKYKRCCLGKSQSAYAA